MSTLQATFKTKPALPQSTILNQKVIIKDLQTVSQVQPSIFRFLITGDRQCGKTLTCYALLLTYMKTKFPGIIIPALQLSHWFQDTTTSPLIYTPQVPIRLRVSWSSYFCGRLIKIHMTSVTKYTLIILQRFTYNYTLISDIHKLTSALSSIPQFQITGPKVSSFNRYLAYQGLLDFPEFNAEFLRFLVACNTYSESPNKDVLNNCVLKEDERWTSNMYSFKGESLLSKSLVMVKRNILQMFLIAQISRYLVNCLVKYHVQYSFL